MNPNVLRLFYTLSKMFRLEITAKLGIEQTMSADSLGFIKHYNGSDKFTDPLDPSLLQITVWHGDMPINVFRESSAAQSERDKKSLYAFFVNTLIYFKYKTCKHVNKK